MLSITFVVSVLFIAMMANSASLEKKLDSYAAQSEKLDSQIAEENERTSEIDELKKYMNTDEYVEEIARDKLGLVKDNEIVFRKAE